MGVEVLCEVLGAHGPHVVVICLDFLDREGGHEDHRLFDGSLEVGGRIIAAKEEATAQILWGRQRGYL